MKIVSRLLIIISVVFLNILNVNAECDDKTRLEINTAASNITMDYNIVTNVVDLEGNIMPDIKVSEVTPEEGSPYTLMDTINVNVENITDKVYVVFYNGEEDGNHEYHYSDLENGSFSYQVKDINNIHNFTLTVYSDVEECRYEEINKYELTTPMYNRNSTFEICIDNDVYYCKKYVMSNFEIPSEDAYKFSLRNNLKTNNEEQNLEKKNHILAIGGGIIIVILIIMICYTLIKRIKRKRMLKVIGGMK